MDQRNNPPTIPGSGQSFNTPDYQNDPLWQRICQHELDDTQAALPLSSKLAEEQKWPPEFTKRVIEEYRRFVYLCCISPTGAAPSKIVDEVWHIHLTYTADYWGKFCKQTLQRELHHYPSRGGPEEGVKHEKWYRQTIDLYTATFHETPPQDCWPPPPPGTISPEPIAITPGYFTQAFKKRNFLLLLLPFFFSYFLYNRFNPFYLTGPHFLVIYLLIIAGYFTTQFLIIKIKTNALDALLRENFTHFAKYEIWHLKGEAQHLYIRLIAELIDNEVIVKLDDGKYLINKDRAETYITPLSAQLANYPYPEIPAEELTIMIAQLKAAISKKYGNFEYEFDDWYSRVLLPAAIFLMGAFRMMQGITHGKPIGFLFLILPLFFLLIRMFIYTNTFRNVCSYLFRNKDAATQHNHSFEEAQVFALLGFWVTENTKQPYASGAGGDSSGGCGSSCGSSCGGGCGGCGGCGG